MLYRRLGKSDLKASVIGLGTAQFGNKIWGYGTKYNKKDVLKIIQTAIDCGINLFDTAEVYANGLSETLLGQAIKEYGRDNFVIVTKVAPWNLRYKNLIKSVMGSLKRLDIDSIDLCLIHHPNPLIRLKETFKAMEDLVKLGKIKYIGVSNFDHRLLVKAQQCLSFSEIVADEIECNIFSWRYQLKTISYCRKQKISVIGYSPLAGGILSGKYSVWNPPKDRARAFNFYSRKSFLKKAQPLFCTLRNLAEKKHATIAQIALSFVISNPICIAIPAALSQEEVRENAEAYRIMLTKDELTQIMKTSVTLNPFTHFFKEYVVRKLGLIKRTIELSLQK